MSEREIGIYDVAAHDRAAAALFADGGCPDCVEARAAGYRQAIADLDHLEVRGIVAHMILREPDTTARSLLRAIARWMESRLTTGGSET